MLQIVHGRGAPRPYHHTFGRALLPQGRVRVMGIRRPESLFGHTTGRGEPRPIYHHILVGCSAMTRSMFS
ncbi:MAG: hypothetical protein ACFHW5_08885 [Verrucomicrobiota bacterium]